MAYVGFDKLKGQLASRPGVTNPGALAATIGRKKYGKAAMAKASKTGHSLKGHKPKHSSARDKKIAQFVKGR
jgi:hypothetical protein